MHKETLHDFTLCERHVASRKADLFVRIHQNHKNKDLISAHEGSMTEGDSTWTDFDGGQASGLLSQRS
jgi:hypothetical protein